MRNLALCHIPMSECSDQLRQIEGKTRTGKGNSKQTCHFIMFVVNLIQKLKRKTSVHDEIVDKK